MFYKTLTIIAFFTIIQAGFVSAEISRNTDNSNQNFIQPNQLLNMVESEKLLLDMGADRYLKIIDVRSACEFGKGRLPNSINFPMHLDTGDNELQLKLYRKNLKAGEDFKFNFIVYSGINESHSLKMFQLLRSLGYSDVKILSGGMNSWVQEGGKVETGDNSVL